MENRVQNLIKFEDYGFKPSAVIKALNEWYEHGGGMGIIFKIELPDPKEGKRKHHAFYDHKKAIDDAIKYLRSMDIFYQPGMKWDDMKFNISTEAYIAEFGYPDVTDAWPKVNPCFVGPRTERDNEIRDYILKLAKAADIKLSIRDESPEDLIYYLFSLLVRDRKDAEAQRERADGYLEKIDRLQEELDRWNCWYNDKERYCEKPINMLNKEE